MLHSAFTDAKVIAFNIPIVVTTFTIQIIFFSRHFHHVTPSIMSDPYYGVDNEKYSSSPIFKHHCSPWIDERIWYKINTKPRTKCSSEQKLNDLPNHLNIKRKLYTSKSSSSLKEKDKLSSSMWSINEGKKNHKSLPNKLRIKKNTPNNEQSDNFYSQSVDDSEDEDDTMSSSSSSSTWWSQHPHPLRMSDNLSPSVCHYTSFDDNHTFDAMKEYLNEMRSYSSQKCLSFTNISINDICDSQPNLRIGKLKNYCFSHCNRYPLINVLSDDAWAKVISSNKTLCYQVVTEIHLMDLLTQDLYCLFQELIARYQCDNYSIKSNCDICKIAYKEWVCSMTLPFYFDGIYIKPCQSFCKKVEQKCPFLHPTATYAGEPVFICIDPGIPYFQNSTNVPYGKEGHCYQSCHLSGHPDKGLENDECILHEHILQNLSTLKIEQELKESLMMMNEPSQDADRNEMENNDPNYLANIVLKDNFQARQLSDNSLIVDISQEPSSKPLNTNMDESSNLTEAFDGQLPIKNESNNDHDKDESKNNKDNHGDEDDDERRKIVLPVSEIINNHLQTDKDDLTVENSNKKLLSINDRSLSYLPIDDDGSDDEDGERQDITTSSSASSNFPTAQPIISTSSTNTKYLVISSPLYIMLIYLLRNVILIIN